jgi:hypothetical protein
MAVVTMRNPVSSTCCPVCAVSAAATSSARSAFPRLPRHHMESAFISSVVATSGRKARQEVGWRWNSRWVK